MSVTELSERTRVRAALIQQMENDDFTGCGGPVYARGHIRSIARVLGIDPESLIAEYDQVHGQVAETPVRASREFDPLTARGGAGRRGFPGVPALVISLTSVCLLIGLAVLLAPSGSGGPTGSTPGGPPAHSPSPLHDVVASTQPAAPVRPPTASPTGVNVQVGVRGNPSWLEARDENARLLLQQILQPGDSRTVTAARSMEIKMGNAGAVEVSCNGQNLGSRGTSGQVVTIHIAPDASGGCTVGDAAPR
jgi:cytoskeletal protein RodZ